MLFMRKILFVLMSLYASVSVFAQKTEEIDGHKAVDLGLSVKWATCNIGANKPAEAGDYFSWGEVKTKKVYDWKNYAYCSGGAKSITKYCVLPAYGSFVHRDRQMVYGSTILNAVLGVSRRERSVSSTCWAPANCSLPAACKSDSDCVLLNRL